MKKINVILYLLNILIGIMIFTNYFFIFNPNKYSIILFILLMLFYIVILFLYFKSKKEMDKTDIIFNSLFYIFMITLFIFSMIYQVNNNLTYNLIYFTKYMIIPHLIKVFYDILKAH